MKYKICSACGINKPINEYHKNKAASHGLVSQCILCSKESSLIYRRSHKGLWINIYIEQCSSSRGRNHPLPSYTSEELYKWVMQQSNYIELYNSWVSSNYNKKMRPSIDRLDNKEPYSLDNIQLVTFYENNKRSHVDAANGEFQELCPVDCFDLQSNYIATYKSISEASRKTGMSSGAIHTACNNINRAAKKYLWRYSGIGEIPKYISTSRTYIQYNSDGSSKYSSNNPKDILNYLGKVDMSPLNKSIRKGTKYLGFTWKISNDN